MHTFHAFNILLTVRMRPLFKLKQTNLRSSIPIEFPIYLRGDYRNNAYDSQTGDGLL
jgi:hypothetical protein